MSPSTSSRALEQLYSEPLPSSRTGALYNAFSYPTKISPETIALFIATHTRPGETILDVFAGSGTAGLAALLCDAPTDFMKAEAARLGLSPVWGPRKAVLSELGTLGAFVSRTMCSKVDPDAFEAAARALLAEASSQNAELYAVRDPNGECGTIRHIIWSDVLACPECDAECSYWDVAVSKSPLALRDRFTCPSCGAACAWEKVPAVFDKVWDSLLKRYIQRRRRVAARVYGVTNNKKWVRDAEPSDLKPRGSSRIPKTVPVYEINWGDLYRSGYHKGITHLHHFYTERNLTAMAALWDLCERAPRKLRDALRLWVLSYNASHSTLMTRVVVKRGNSDFVLTGAQSGVLYVSHLPVEKNIFLGLERKIDTFRKAFEQVYSSGSSVRVVQGSSEHLPVPPRSVSYVFTDPPFGDYIPYAELNQLNEAWLGKLTKRSREIIVSAASGKTVADYSRMMGSVFKEIRRVLKPKGSATVVFHSAHPSIWASLISAYQGARMEVGRSTILARTQQSFKQVVSPTSVQGDPLLLLVPRRVSAVRRSRSSNPFDTVLQAAIASRRPAERTPERLYSRYIVHCLESNEPVTLGAEAFYSRAREALGL